MAKTWMCAKAMEENLPVFIRQDKIPAKVLEVDWTTYRVKVQLESGEIEEMWPKQIFVGRYMKLKTGFTLCVMYDFDKKRYQDEDPVFMELLRSRGEID